jgi:hypothetical protein
VTLPRRALAVALVCACATAAAAPRARSQGGAVKRERIELRVTFHPWESAGTFSLETSGGLGDEGSARDQGGFSASGGGVRRVLESEKGTLILRLRGRPRPGQPPVIGRWTLAGGTGAYAGMTGGGTFVAMSGGEQRGASPYELQVLVGRVER